MLEKFRVKLIKILLGTSDVDLLDDIKPMMDKYNLRTAIFSTISFFIVLVLLALASVIVEKMRWMLWGYLIFAFVIAVLFILTRIDKVRDNKKVVISILYIEVIMSLAFGVIVGNLGQPDIIAVSYHVLLIALPLFICDYPWKLNVIYILFTIPFLYTSCIYKETKAYRYDLMNCIIYTILGIFVNTVIQINHFESLGNRCLIKRQRDTDTLTGTLTKKAFELRAQEEMRKDNSVGVFMIFDIDDFKNINDTLGHAIGDYFISNTGHLILNHCRQTDIVGRFGGDEFVIYMPGCDSEEFIQKKAQEFMSSLKEYFTKNMSYEKFSISIGSTVYNDHTKTYKELFNEIDDALYQAKKSGKDKCCIYKSEIKNS